MSKRKLEQAAADCHERCADIDAACEVITLVGELILDTLKKGDGATIEIDASQQTRDAFRQARKALKQQRQSFYHVALCLENKAQEATE